MRLPVGISKWRHENDTEAVPEMGRLCLACDCETAPSRTNKARKRDRHVLLAPPPRSSTYPGRLVGVGRDDRPPQCPSEMCLRETRLKLLAPCSRNLLFVKPRELRRSQKKTENWASFAWVSLFWVLKTAVLGSGNTNKKDFREKRPRAPFPPRTPVASFPPVLYRGAGVKALKKRRGAHGNRQFCQSIPAAF